MHFPRQYFVLLPMTAAISLLLFSCGESRTAQCNKIIQVANGAVSEAKSVTKEGENNDPKAMLKAADAMETASQKMEDIEVKDEKLQTYQADFIKMYIDTGQATREFVAAFEREDRPAAEQALVSLQEATTPEKRLVAEINNYCSPEVADAEQ